MTKNIFLLLIIFSNFIFAQNKNNYIYASIPSKFDFQKEKNEHRINSTLKAFFVQKGFTTFLDDEILSESFSQSNCNKIYIDLEVKNSMFKTSLFVVLKDCKNNILLKSEEGSSRNKNIKTAYNESLLIALKSIQNLEFKQSEIQIKAIEKNADLSINKNPNVIKNEQFYSLKMIVKKSKTFVNLLITSQPNLFIANSNEKNGIVTLIDKKYFFEYYSNNVLISEELEMLP